MAPISRSIIFSCILLLTYITFSNAVESDISCLRSIKDSLEDPQNFLSSWNFNSNTTGFICRFTGVECWHPDEDRVLNIRLSDMGLRGKLPIGLKNCSSMTGLDLSSNNLSGPLPANISGVLRFVTTLDLSSNNFSGPIPSNFVNCSYLNVLKLDNNRFSGKIPSELGGLSRLREFSVRNNRLSGQVPNFRNANISAESYKGNSGLCGGPLPPCRGSLTNL